MRRAALAALGVLALVVVPALPASAHPLGNFTVNRYDGLLVQPDGVRIDHVVDLAEIPTVQVRRGIDSDQNGKFGTSELKRWAGDQCATERSLLALEVAGTPTPLRLTSATARSVPGEAGLATLRVECQLFGAARLGAAAIDVSFSDDAPQQVGWREITVRGDAMTIAPSGGALPRSRSISRRLTSYPEDLLSSPLNERAVAFQARAGGPSETQDSKAQEVLPRPTERLGAAFTGLVGGSDLGLGAAVLAIGLALLIGAMHAVAPGHGKTIMAFYLVGRGESRARAARAALTVGATVTLTHTAGVLVLGLIVAVTASATPAAAYPWLAAASGLVIAVVGLGLLREALRRRATGHHGHFHGPGTHSHGLGSHSHGAAPEEHQHPEGSTAGHDHPHPHDEEHEHPHPHPHDPDELHEHPHPHDEEHRHPHPHDHDEPHEHPHDHEHPRHQVAAVAGVATSPAKTAVLDRPASGSSQQGAPQQASTPSRRGRGRAGLIAVGIAGGLVPSPSALVVLLGAAAVGRAWFGVLLVVAFGLGMAMTLSATGLLLVLAQDKFKRFSHPRWNRAGRFYAIFPVVSASAVCILGFYLTLRGLTALP